MSRALLGNIRWKHWAGAAAVGGIFNVGILAGMAKTYRWYFADDEEQVQKFQRKYGLPTEQQRLEVFAWLAPKWDKTIGMVEKRGADVYRRELLPTAQGDVLEVAVGTGRCLEALSKSGEIRSFVGVDCVQEMLDAAKPKLEEVPFSARVEIADAHRLPFPDDSFDTVISSLCLCSVERPEDALDEMARVCRPGGQVLFIEPGLAKRWLVRFAQNYLGLIPNPMHAWECGWYDDRDPPTLIGSCRQLTIQGSVQTRVLGNWYLITAAPNKGKNA